MSSKLNRVQLYAMHSDTPAGLMPAPPAPARLAGLGPAPADLSSSSCNTVLVLTPRSFHDARRVIEAVRDNRTVLVNSAWLEDSPGQRLIDFACGGITAICGQVHRIAEEVFLFAPAAVRVAGDGSSGTPGHGA